MVKSSKKLSLEVGLFYACEQSEKVTKSIQILEISTIQVKKPVKAETNKVDCFICNNTLQRLTDGT